jgi:uncharacterized membrane protein (UPF0182 family)
MWTGPRKAALAAAAFLLVLLVAGRLVADVVVDLLWYRSLQLEQIFWTRWNAAVAVRAVAGVIIAGVVFWNLRIVARSFGNIRVRRRYANIEIAERVPQSYVISALLAASLLSAWWLSGAMGDPVAVLAFFRAPLWGIQDPVFGRDLSFYVFTYPILDRIQSLLGVLVLWTFMLAAVCYVATGSLRWSESGVSVSPGARRHLGMIAAALFLIFAWDTWLDRYQLLMLGQGIGGALGYTDVAARIPARAIVSVLAVVAGASLAYGAWHGSLREPVLGVGALVVGALLAQVVYPSVLQKFRVEPDELARETPYIASNLEFTRLAYGLSTLERRRLSYAPRSALDPAEVTRAVAGVPLWDPGPLLQSYQALETRRQYYNFVNSHYDRYGQEQVVISVRELEAERLDEVARTWQNLHLRYVRGEGAVVSPAARLSGSREPPYYLSDICPVKVAPDAPAGLALSDPAVYFGERTRGYVIVTPGAAGATVQQCAAGGEPVGVPLDSWPKKLVYAWAFQSKNLLLSDQLTARSRIVYRRLVQQRAAAIAPFLLFPAESDGNVYPVVSDGRIVWVAEAYTASVRFPLAPVERLGQAAVRYIRNSVKVTVDAVTGDVAFYVVDEQDPMLRTYRNIFPSLFRTLDEMPADLRNHLRFPAPLLALQARVLREYHLVEPAAFYSREAVWDIPTEMYRDQPQTSVPAYVMMPLPGAQQPEFLLSIPFVAAGRQTMTALLVARNDPPNYGEQILFELPREEGIPGPQQIESLIDQNPEISQQLSLWKRGGSDVIRGHLLVVPVDSSLVFVEPLFLVAQASAIPQLERVIAATGNQVAMRPTLSAAINAITGAEPAEAAAPPPVPPSPAASTGTAARTRMRRALRLMERAEAQLRAGNWAGFGETWTELRDVLRSAAGAPDDTL